MGTASREEARETHFYFGCGSTVRMSITFSRKVTVFHLSVYTLEKSLISLADASRKQYWPRDQAPGRQACYREGVTGARCPAEQGGRGPWQRGGGLSERVGGARANCHLCFSN